MDNSIKMEIIKQQSINRIMNNPDFISWLCVFSSKNVYFTNSESDLGNFSVKDRTNIRYLGIFYEIVSDYAKKNFITSEDGSFIVSYKNHAFRIGYIDNYLFCQRIQYDSVLDCIDFMDIKNGKPSKKSIKVRNVLENLPEVICGAYRAGAPIENISEVVNDTLDSIKKGDKVIKLIKEK